MKEFIELISQRRIWAAIAGFVSMILMVAGVKYDVDMTNFTDLLNNFGIALANLLTVILPVLSYVFPKKAK